MNRRLPRWSELRPLIAPASGARTRPRHLARAASIRDLRAIARRRVPRAVFDYVDGAAETETSLARARSAFARVEFQPRVLRDVSRVDTSTTLLGRPAALPLVLAPTGFTRLMHAEGEPAVARAAAALGIPYALSTMGTTTPEDLAAAAPKGDNWFQLYMGRDRAAAMELVRRAEASAYSALILTVDTAVAGARLRDVRNGLTIPPSLAMSTMLDMARYPSWWLNLLTTRPLSFACVDSSTATFADVVDELLDPALTFDDLAALRQAWSGPLVVKGIQSVRDARRVVDLGADAVVVSNHGGRQLDRAPVPLELLPGVVEAVGDQAEVYLDGGVLTGGDVVAAVALGAKAVLVGRAYLYGLMAGGRQGVEHAGEILRADILRTMRLLGVATLDELGPHHLRLRPAGPSTV
nr:quinone-dependent L-lactate dehydrogenase [Actinomadura rugatobispora]